MASRAAATAKSRAPWTVFFSSFMTSEGGVSCLADFVPPLSRNSNTTVPVTLVAAPSPSITVFETSQKRTTAPATLIAAHSPLVMLVSSSSRLLTHLRAPNPDVHLVPDAYSMRQLAAVKCQLWSQASPNCSLLHPHCHGQSSTCDSSLDLRSSSRVRHLAATHGHFGADQIIVRHFSEARRQGRRKEEEETGLASQEDLFGSITDKIPERPVTATEGASYSVVILLGLALAGGALYYVVRELLIEPREYQVFSKALSRVQKDAQVISFLGSPITGYGQDSRNRAARQRISNKVWKDEDGVEKIMVQFHIRGPGGAGLVHCEMFKDPEDRNKLKYTYLVVDITHPVPRRLMLESYIPK